jgi:ABC-type polysaccharide/polyol phosphate export permease
MTISEYLPHVAIGFVFWGLLSSMVNEGCAAFLEAEPYMKHIGLPKSAFVLRVLFRNLLMLAHNFVIVIAVLLIFWIPLHPVALLAIPALVVIVLNGFWAGLLLGTLSARFRDVPQTVTSLMQVIFFMTPVMFHSSQLGAGTRGVLEFNPFAALLALVRDPMLGHAPRMHDVILSLGTLVVGWLVTIPFFGKFRDRIVYWL